jgi:hypothetical protein
MELVKIEDGGEKKQSSIYSSGINRKLYEWFRKFLLIC